MTRFAENVEIIGGSLILKQPTGLGPVSGLTPMGEKIRIRIRAEDERASSQHPPLRALIP
jgi:hypothetical protein